MSIATNNLRFTHIGGPTLRIETDGVRILTDPTFDPPGGSYLIPRVGATTVKTAGPALAPQTFERIDAVLLSHDEHADNLDTLGRSLLARADIVLTTRSAAARLGDRSLGLVPWESRIIAEGKIRVSATPARHGPPGSEPLLGDVTGFVVESLQGRFAPIYISGDTVMYEAIPEIAHHFDVQTAVLHLGRVQPQADGPRFTMSADDACAAFDAVAAEWLIPVHYADWAHFSEGREAAAETFERHGLSERVRWLEPGVPTEL